MSRPMYAPLEKCSVCTRVREKDKNCRNELCGSHYPVAPTNSKGLNQCVLRLDIYLDLTKMTEEEIEARIDGCLTMCEKELPVLKQGIRVSKKTGSRYGYSEHRDDRYYDISLIRGVGCK